MWITLCFLTLDQFYVVYSAIYLTAAYNFFVNRPSCYAINQQLQWVAS